MIKVTNSVTIYEVDGQERTDVPPPAIQIHSHWNRSSLVVIEAAGKRLTVSADDLAAAIKNATNSGRF